MPDSTCDLPTSDSISLPQPDDRSTDKTLKKQSLLIYRAFTQGVGQGFRKLIVLAFAGFCATGSIAFLATSTLVSPPPEIDCSAHNPSFSEHTTLACLRAAIATDDTDAVLKALTWVADWERTHPLYYETQRLLESWSSNVLLKARQHQGEGKTAEAIALIEQIPPISPRYEDARILLEQLQSELKLQDLVSYGGVQVD